MLRNERKYLQFNYILIAIALSFSMLLLFIDTLKVAEFLGVLIFIVSLIIVCRQYGVFSIPTFFIVLSYLFHCSQFFLDLFSVKYNVAFDIIKTIGDQGSIATIKFFSFSIVFLTLGFIFVKTNRRVCAKRKLNSKQIITLGKVFCVCFFIPRFYIDIISLLTFFKSGYEATYFVVSAGLMDIVAYGFYIGVILLIVGYKESIRRSKRITILFLIYLMITMICGKRMVQASILLVVILIYLKYVRKIKLKVKSVLGIIVLAYVIFAMIATFGDLRYNIDPSLGIYISTFFENIFGKMIAGQIAEFGDTGISLAYAIKYFGNDVPYNYGMTYLNSWFQIFPNINGSLEKLFGADFAFVKALPPIEHNNFGCSFLGELYYNFGIFGSVICLITGCIIGKSTYCIEDAFNNGFTIKTLIILFLLPTLLSYVRGSFSDFIRLGVWFGILLYVLKMILYRVKKELSEEKLRIL